MVSNCYSFNINILRSELHHDIPIRQDTDWKTLFLSFLYDHDITHMIFTHYHSCFANRVALLDENHHAIANFTYAHCSVPYVRLTGTPFASSLFKNSLYGLHGVVLVRFLRPENA